ncbi:MAG: hypothetical protein ACJA0O_001790 [Porticoccus sp.]|jgi:hypothetical protein
MSLLTEVIIDHSVTRKKSLSMVNRFELPHLSLLLSAPLVRVFCNIVFITSRVVRNLAAHFSQGSRITFQFIRYYSVGGYPMAFE